MNALYTLANAYQTAKDNADAHKVVKTEVEIEHPKLRQDITPFDINEEGDPDVVEDPYEQVLETMENRILFAHSIW